MIRRALVRSCQKIGWWLMGIPWMSHESVERGFAKNNWHAKIYLLGMRLHNYE